MQSKILNLAFLITLTTSCHNEDTSSPVPLENKDLSFQTNQEIRICYEQIQYSICLKESKEDKTCLSDDKAELYIQKIQKLHTELPIPIKNIFCSLSQINIIKNMDNAGSVVAESNPDKKMFSGFSMNLNEKIFSDFYSISDAMNEKEKDVILSSEMFYSMDTFFPAYKYIFVHELGHIISLEGKNEIFVFDTGVWDKFTWIGGEIKDEFKFSSYDIWCNYKSRSCDFETPLPYEDRVEIINKWLESPFPTLYSSSSVGEDFADTFSMHYLKNQSIDLFLNVGESKLSLFERNHEILDKKYEFIEDFLSRDLIFYP